MAKKDETKKKESKKKDELKKKVEKKKEIKEKETIDIKKIEIELNKYLEDRKVDITKEITNKIDEQIELKVTKRMKEEEKKIVRGKSMKIIRRDILIILLLALLGYFGYCLYKVDYFNIRTKIVETPKENEDKKDNNNDNKTPNENDKPVVDTKPDSSYYINNYSYLIDNILIDDEKVFSLFSKKGTKENLSNELIQKIAYKNLDKLLITINNDMITFHKDSLLESAKKIFGEDIIIKDEMFNYNNTKFMYYNETYIGLKDNDTKTGLLSKIIDAKEENNKLEFNVIITKLSDENALLDKENNIIIENYNNEDLTIYKDKLPTFTITYENINNNYIFSSIE